MSNQCRCCGGRCGPAEAPMFSRREFLERLAVGTAGLAVLGELPMAGAAEEQAPLTLPKVQGARPYSLTPPRVYRGKNLEAVAMPIGGIGTGSIWLDGQGRLGVWQIFNNQSETRIPDSFFAVRARAGQGEAVTRVLQTVEERSLQPVESLEYEGGYPIARLALRDSKLPVEVSMEAFNPMIPLDTRNSSIPCAIFRVTAKNPGKEEAEVALFASLQNAVGSGGAAGIRGVEFVGYGGNVNEARRHKGSSLVAMTRSPDPVQPGPVKVRGKDGQLLEGPELVWLDGTQGLTAPAAETLARIAADGGVALVSGASAAFFQAIAALRDRQPGRVAVEVFEDFERADYSGWTLTGDAFGKRPSRGTEGGQQAVSGFAGRGLVNTFIAGDGPHGTATSKPFEIKRRYVGFLIGGGSYKDQTCINLKVDGKVVRTATGKDVELLEPASWDVGELKGKTAVIEIVDKNSAPWGHINIDQIVFSDLPPEPFLKQGTAADRVARALRLSFTAAEEATSPAEQAVTLTDGAPAAIKPLAGVWKTARYTRLVGFQAGQSGFRTLAANPDGSPLLIEGPLGKGRVVLVLAPGLPWSWGSELLAAARGGALQPGQQLVPGAPAWGTMALGALDPEAIALPAWTTAEELTAFVAGSTGATPRANGRASAPGNTVNAVLGVPFKLAPGQSRTVTFTITWHFPNVQRFQHQGNLYSRRWLDAPAVARYVADNLPALWERTKLYHETLYQSNLPEEFLDAMTSQCAILRGPTCWWSEEGYFGGFEGSYGCCPLNCTHVWNYAQTHARLFPEVGRNMRISNFLTFLHPSGETSHREHGPHNAFIDGHCACIEAALREHQLSSDRRFLEQVWPGVKKAVNWLIGAIDKERQGVPSGHQWNTYDTAVSGANTFIGSQYLAALAAGEQMALLMNDAESAKQWREVRQAGMKNQDEKLWGGEYYIQIPGPKPDRDYNTGCHADQLLGQWWAHMLNLGYLYPVDRVKKALQAVMKHNMRETFAGFKQDPRRYVLDDEGGLLICTWPHGGRPKPFILYADEVWTGIEYSTAGAMIYEGLIDEARKIVRTARSRYDGRQRDNLNSGPGGNPYNELECGKFYARALSSWSLLLASQGQVLDGPKGVLGFKPRWQPADHRSFFTAPEGWGLFIQRREEAGQSERIEVRHGRLRLKELVFELLRAAAAKASVTVEGRALAVALSCEGSEVRLVLEQEVLVPEGSAIEVTLRW